MSSQEFSARMCSLRPNDLIDWGDDDQDTQLQQEFERFAKTVNPAYILDCVLTDLDDLEVSPLRDYILDAIRTPYDPERPRINQEEARVVGTMVLTLIAKAQANQVNLKMAVMGGR